MSIWDNPKEVRRMGRKGRRAGLAESENPFLKNKKDKQLSNGQLRSQCWYEGWYKEDEKSIPPCSREEWERSEAMFHAFMDEMDELEKKAAFSGVKSNPKLVAAAAYDTAQALESICCWLLHRFGPDSPEGSEARSRLPIAKAARITLWSKR
jgi:hypothetical protein